MGWTDIMVAVEYDGEHHRKNTVDYRKDIARLEYIHSAGWIVVRVVAGNRPREIVERVRRARASRLR
jgi:very-short-patch-repair endonuclease